MNPSPTSNAARPLPTTKSLLAGWFWEVIPFVLIVAAALVIFRPLTSHPTDLLVGTQHHGKNDLTSAFLAFQSVPRLIASRTGEFPWWNPWMLGGSPCYGNPQSALLYPPNWIYRFGDPLWLISWMMVAHHVWGGWGAYRLARRWNCRWETGLVAGVAYLGAPFLVAQTGEGHYNQICVVAWIPWAWLAWERLVARQRGGALALVATLALSFLAGHAQEWYYLLLLLGALTVGELVRRWRRGERAAAGQLARDSLLSVLLAIGLVAVELVPIYFYTSQTVRGEAISAAAAGSISLGLPSIRQLFEPFVWGGPDAYRGPGHFYWETLFHFGLLPGTLAAISLCVPGRSDQRWKLALLAALGIAFAFGDGSPVFTLAHRLIPGVGMFRAPSRVLFFVSLLVALLAALGLDRLLAWRIGSSDGEGASVRSRPVAFRAWQFVALLVVGLTTVELARYSGQILRSVPTDALRDPQDLLASLNSTADVPRVLADQALLSDREAWHAGVVKLQGYDPVPLTRQVALIDALSKTPDPAPLALGFAPIKLDELNSAALQAAGVRWAVVTPQAAPVPSDWRLVRRGRMPEEFALRGTAPAEMDYELYENSAALPRAFVVGQVLQAGARESVELMAEFDPRRDVLLTADVLPAAEADQRSEFREAKVLSAGVSRLTVAVELERPGYLVVQDTLASGWRATVDGQPVAILPANVASRAVPLAAGAHQVEFTFSPPGLMLGASITLVSMLLLGWWQATAWRRPVARDERRVRQPAEATPLREPQLVT